MTTGIYKITNNLTKQFYIGQSKNIERRLMEHKTPRNNKLPIDKAIKEFGKNNFTYQVLEKCEESQLLELEREYIISLKPQYNKVWKGKKRDGQFCNKVKQRTKEWWESLTKEKQSKIVKNNLSHRFPKNHEVGKKELEALARTWTANQKPVRIIETRQKFDSIKDCEKFLGASEGTIAKYFKGKLKTVKGYQIEKV